jgi:hypothetical protein
MSDPVIVGVDAGCATLGEADLLIQRIVESFALPPDTVACTHAVGVERIHVALSFALPPTWREQQSWRRVAQVAGDLAIARLAAARAHRDGDGVAVGAGTALARFGDVRALVAGPVGVATETESIGPPELAAGAAQAVAAHADRRGGRAVVYPGVGRLRGTVRVETVLGQTAVGQVVAPAGQNAPRGGDLLRTRDHVRPVWQDGVLTLLADADTERGRVFVPSEVPQAFLA